MTRARASAAAAALPAFLFGIYPIAAILSANARALPVDFAVVGRAVVASIVAVAVLLWALRLFIRDFQTRAVWLGWFLLFFSCYGFVIAAIRSLGGVIQPETPWVALVYVALSVVATTFIVRPRGTAQPNPVIPTLVAGVLVGTNLLLAGIQLMSSYHSKGLKAADQLIAASMLQDAGTPPKPVRDVFYLVLDGFGRSDTLREIYNFDSGPFIQFLESKQFTVPSQARSNYSQTFLSLASTLNLAYLDDLATALGRDAATRVPLERLIQNNALMGLAKNAGYQVIGVGSNYLASKEFAAADICRCGQFGLDSTELAALRLTPLAPVALSPTVFEAHRRKVLDSFDSIERAASIPSPTFVFAHIVAPHPPFVFHPDGSARPTGGFPFMLNDGNHFRGSQADYIAGYRDQVQFIQQRLEKLVERLLSGPGPAPVVILHGDHGPGSLLRWEDPAATNQAERLSIFAAYHFPESSSAAALYPTMTPINGARLLANEYFGAQLPLQRDESFLSTWTRPFDFLPVR